MGSFILECFVWIEDLDKESDTILHTKYPKFIYNINSDKIKWLSNMQKLKDNLSEDELANLQIELYEKAVMFSKIKNNGNK